MLVSATKSIVLALISALVVSMVIAAPAPPKKPAAAATGTHIGIWVMTWKGINYRDTHFNPDGSYKCGDDWLGSWKIIGASTLSVHEFTKSGTVLDWAVEMDKDFNNGNLLEDKSPFKLQPSIAPPDAPKITD